MPLSLNPKHIDFVITYQDKWKTDGYWFMTFINGPMDCKVWYKARNGIWYIAGSNFFNKDTFYHSYQRGGIFPDSNAQANVEEQTAMDKLLDDHLNAGDYSDNFYIYWPNAQDTMAS